MVRTYGRFLRRNRRYGLRKVTRKNTATKIRRAARAGYRRLMNANAKLSVYRAPNPFPRSRIVRHRYVENISFPGAAAATVRSYIFGANDLYDPNFTGIGHQPMYRDEMAAKYKYYTVLRSVIKVTFDQQDQDMQNYGIILGQDTTLSSNVITLKEQYGGTKPIVTANRDKPLTLTKYYDATKLNRVSLSALLADDTHRVERDTSPGAKAAHFYSVWACPVDGTLITEASLMQVEILYTAIWREPQDAVQS